MSQKKKRSETFAWFRAIALSVLIVIIVRTFILGNYIVDGPSMEPTLYNGDRLIVNKINYKLSQPKRFDVVIFHATKTDDYVKRVIGLPGDTIRYSNDQLYVNGKPVNEPFLKEKKNSMLAGQLTWDFTLKELTGKERVPKGMLWVMGDNRQNSTDSRVFHFVSERKVVGKVDLRYWPYNHFGIIHRN
ncbi:signal peptidase I [Sporolactobacillus laevolacticus]|jgi:signal peptidase I|uniref:Signal peptidase I n=1 Tax=Sporolactobacillus laevolacticus DSM 442 TaxID=1395513 RepID=V6ITW0_9BACL|nr:signal peptidase I [Sporolactobacillus laevolacticus]EST10282.1 signal peptidase I [Sporolactobacillus laevolacticus DSM 442]